MNTARRFSVLAAIIVFGAIAVQAAKQDQLGISVILLVALIAFMRQMEMR